MEYYCERACVGVTGELLIPSRRRVLISPITIQRRRKRRGSYLRLEVDYGRQQNYVLGYSKCTRSYVDH